MAVDKTRKCLLIVRAGDGSLHPRWLTGKNASSRNWDLHISYFGDLEDPFPGMPADVTMTREKGTKLPAMVVCMEKLGSRIDDYDYVGIPDDDVLCDGANWTRFFEIVQQYSPAVAQPALDHRSYFTFNGLLRRRAYRLRWTNFVEVMAPIFSREALKLAAASFSESFSGWGPDLLWPKLFHAEKLTLCVVDETPILHIRAVGRGALYKLVAATGKLTPYQERQTFMDKYGLTLDRFKVFKAVTRDGVEIDGGGATERRLVLPVLWHRLRLKLGILQVNLKPAG